ncbi:MAG: type II secretion system F family protein [Chlamydiales bacterium]
MPLYKYHAINENQKKQSGIIDAESHIDALEFLNKKKILTIDLNPYIWKPKSITLSRKELLFFTQDLSQFLWAGLPLYESLLALEERYQNTKNHAFFLHLCNQIKQGRALSQILSDFPKSFDVIYISMVGAAEKSGKLGQIFKELSVMINKSDAFKKKITAALTYPIFLITFCCIVLYGLFFFLIPSMQELLQGRNLHPVTEVVLQISQFLQKYKRTLGVGLLSTAIAIFCFFRSTIGKLNWQRFSLHIPFLKTLITESVLVRFCNTLSVLLESNVPLIESLDYSKRVMNHSIFQSVIDKVETSIIEGNKLSTEISKSKLFPSMAIRMIEVGEQVGNIGEMLQNIAQIYEKNLERTLQKITVLLQPILLLFLGIVVGTILLSVLLPLTDMSSFTN